MATGKTAAMTTPPSTSAPVKKPSGLIWAGVILVVLAIVLFSVAIAGIVGVVAMPAGTNFTVPGSATVRLEPGTYAVWVSNGSTYGNGSTTADVDVTGPNGPVRVDRVSSSVFLNDGSLEFVDRAEFEATSGGRYEVAVDSSSAEVARVASPVSASRLALSIGAIIASVFAGLIGFVLFVIGLIRRARAGRPAPAGAPGYGPPPGYAPTEPGYGPPPGYAPTEPGYGPPPGQPGYGPPPGPPGPWSSPTEPAPPSGPPLGAPQPPPSAPPGYGQPQPGPAPSYPPPDQPSSGYGEPAPTYPPPDQPPSGYGEPAPTYPPPDQPPSGYGEPAPTYPPPESGTEAAPPAPPPDPPGPASPWSAPGDDR
jgi:hypothetical protein